MLFEDAIECIDAEIQRKRGKWTLTAIRHMDFDDVAQILRIHISDKWHLYDPSKPLKPWLGTVISNKLINLIRDNYGRYARPCLQCDSAGAEESCDIYITQCVDCPAFRAWRDNKRDAYNIKMPSLMDGDLMEINRKKCDYMDYSLAISRLSEKMKTLLKPAEYRVYRMSFIDNISDEDIVSRLGYKAENRTRSRGTKYVRDAKKRILEVAKSVLGEGDIPFCSE